MKSMKSCAVVLAALVPVLAHADAADAVAAVAAAQADALSVAGGLLSMGVAVWGAMFLYRKFFK